MQTARGMENMDEATLGETVDESSGEVDSGRSHIYNSYHCSSQIVSNISGSLRNSSRVCSHCGTSKTPLWRSGPQGPKSLCNACGIRLKKSGRRNVKNDLRRSSWAAPEKSQSCNHTVSYDHFRSIIKKRRRTTTRKEAQESSEMENASGNTSPQDIIRHYARCDAGRDLSQLKSSLVGFLEKLKLARGLVLSNAAGRDEEEGAILLMALSYGYLNA